MRIRLKKVSIFSIIVAIVILLFGTWKLIFEDEISSYNKSTHLSQSQVQSERKQTDKPRDRIEEANAFLRDSLTIVFRDFYDFDNDLKSGVEHLLTLVPNINILVISDDVPYPPMSIFASYNHPNQTLRGSSLIYKENVKFLSLRYDISKPAVDSDPVSFIQTKYTLLMPDSFRLSNGRQLFQRLIKSLGHNQLGFSNRQILVVPFTSNNRLINYCFQLNADIKNWTLNYEVKNSTKNCNLFTQKNALMLETRLLSDFHEPFASPFPEYFFLQAKFANIKLKYSNETLADGRKLMTSYHSRVKRKVMKKAQFKEIYRKLEFKKIVKQYQFVQVSKIVHQKSVKKNKKNSNINKNKEIVDVIIEPLDLPSHILKNHSLSSLVQLRTDMTFFGCEKNTKSCVSQIFNGRPFYLYLNRHLPPCCREKLKTVFLYVVEELENTGVRYWLDNQALRDAHEIDDLSSDAFEIDISFNVNDYNRSTPLKRSFDSRPFIDPSAGFYWIKATDGQYIKVQFSKINEIHVNLFPFEINNNLMRPRGFYGPKAREFPVEFLHPTSNLFFLGRNIFAPNKPKPYLEAKGFVEKK